MKTEDFEKKILAKGLKPLEVRLEHNQVKWFICDKNDDYDIIVFDRWGNALVRPRFDWPDEVEEVEIHHYYDKEGNTMGVTFNGWPAMRANSLDLNLPCT